MEQNIQQQTAPNVSKENQELYDIFVAQGIKLAIAASQKLSGRASIESLGNTLFEIVSKIEDEGSKHGVVFNMPVLLHGSNEILGHLIEMTGTQVNEEQIKKIIGLAVGKYLKNAIETGKMTVEQVQQIAAQGQQNPQLMGQQNTAQQENIQEGVLNARPTQ